MFNAFERYSKYKYKFILTFKSVLTFDCFCEEYIKNEFNFSFAQQSVSISVTVPASDYQPLFPESNLDSEILPSQELGAALKFAGDGWLICRYRV